MASGEDAIYALIILTMVIKRMCLTASSKTRKEVCAYGKVCAYKKGAHSNPSLRYLKQTTPHTNILKPHSEVDVSLATAS